MGGRFLTDPVVIGSQPSKINPYQSGQNAYSQSIASSFQPAAVQERPGISDYLLNIPQSILSQGASLAGHAVGGAGRALQSANPPVPSAYSSLPDWLTYLDPANAAQGALNLAGRGLETVGQWGIDAPQTPMFEQGWFGQSTAPLATRETFEAAEGIPASTIEAIKFAVEEFPEALTYAGAIMVNAPAVVAAEVDRIAGERAVADGRSPQEYTMSDATIAAIPAIANVYLERLGIKYGLGRAPQFLQKFASSNPAIRIATAGVAQSGIEAVQEGIEYPATVLGTQTPYDSQEALARSKMGAIAGALPGATFGAAGEVARQVAPVDRATAAGMAADIRDVEAPGVELLDREVRLETPVPQAEMEDGTIPYYTERQGVYEAPTPAEYNMAGTTEAEAQPGRKVAFIQTIYDNETKANDGKAPSRFRMRQALRNVILEEGVSHSQLLEALTDKIGFLNSFYESRSSDIEAWMEEDASGIPYRDEYIGRVSEIEESNLTPEQKTESIQSLQRGLAAEYIAEIGRNEGLSSSNFRFVLKQIQSSIKKALGVNVSPFSNAEIVEMLILARNNSRKGVRPDATTASDASAALSSKGGLQDPSRRKFLKQTGGAIAGAVVDPSIILEPATPTPPIAPPGFAGGIMRPGIAPEYESAMRAAEMASPSGLVSDAASEAFDEFDMEAAAREDQELADQLKAYEAEQVEKEKVPQKWRELETPELQALMEENRAKGNAIWVAQNKELESRVAEPIPQLTTEDRVTLEEAGEADAMALSLDNIYSTFDSDYSVADAILDGALDKLVRMEAQNSNFTRQELWDAVNARESALEDIDAESDRRAIGRDLELSALPRAQMTDAEVLNRDVRNEATKKYRKAINNSEISDDEKSERSNLLKDLLRPWGVEGINRGLTPGDRETFRRYADMIVEGELDAVREFIRPFLDRIASEKAPSKTKKAKRDYYAGYKGVSADELAEYRERGKTHPMEKKMTYPFADEEINRLEAGGEITANEAENRRRVAREFRAALQGKLPQTAKRKLTEIVYGIEDYADITPWTEKYTTTEVEGMGERAEVAQAEARRTRYEKTQLTKLQQAEILEESITAEERAALAEMEDNELFDNLKTRKDRLLFLRNPSPMSEAERAELDAFLSDVKGFDQTKYQEARTKETEKMIEESDVEITRLPSVPTEGAWTPQKDRMLWKTGTRIRQVGQSEWDTLESSAEYELAGEAYTAEGELVTELDGFEFLDDSLSSLPKIHQTPQAIKKRLDEYEATANRITEAVIDGDMTADEGIAELRGVATEKDPETQLPKYVSGKAKRSGLFAQIRVREGAHIQMMRDVGILNKTGRELRKEVWKRSFSIIDRSLVSEVERSALRSFGAETPYGQRKEDGETLRALERENAGGTNKWHVDHVVAINIGGMNFALNLMPLPQWANTALSDKPLSAILEADTKTGERFRRAFAYMEDSENWEGSSELQILARAFDVAVNAKPGEYNNLADMNLPDGGMLLRNEAFRGKKGLALRLALYQNQELAFKGQLLARGMDWDVESAQIANLAKNFEAREKKIHEQTLSSWKSKESEKAGYTEHFSDKFWYRLTSFLWGKPVQAIRDFNKFTRFGQERGTIKAADEIADNIQRAHSSTQRTEGMEKGTDMMQDISMRTGEFFSILSRTFARATDNEGVIDAARNKQLIDHLAGKAVKFTSKEIKEAAYQLEALVRTIYKYAKTETGGLKSPLDLRGHGDTLVPRVWNIEYLATRRGKAKFLRFISAHFSPPGKTTPVFESADITAEDLYDVVINSGGFVQGEWTNIKADQTRTEKDIAKDLAIQEYLDALQTENLMDENMLLDDLQAIMPRFVQKAVERTEYSKRFGKNDDILRDLIKQGIDQIREHNRIVLKMKKGKEKLPHIDEKRFEQSVWDMSRILRNKYGYDMANMPARKWLQRAQNIQVIMKLPLVTLASMPEFFTPMLRGDVRPDKWFVDFLGASAWAGYKGMNGMSKLLFNTHLPAMRKKSAEIGGIGIIRDIALLRELGIADIQAMGDLVATRYANPNFARGGLRGGARGTLAGRVPKGVRAVFNMQTYMQATFLTTMTEMQQFIALRNFQRHVSKRLEFIAENSGKKDTPRRRRLLKQFRQDLLDYGITDDINLDTSRGLAEFNAGALRFVDQVITRPNDATTAKIFKNPLTAPLVLFKRFITTYGNTLLTAVGNDIAHKVDNVERAKQVGKVAVTAMTMYGAVMFAEIMRGVIMGDLDEDDFKLMPDDFKQFMRRIDRTGLPSAPGALLINLAFPYKRGWWDTTESRITGELFGPIFGDATALGDALLDDKSNTFQRLMRQLIPMSRIALPSNKKKENQAVSNFESY